MAQMLYQAICNIYHIINNANINKLLDLKKNVFFEIIINYRIVQTDSL